MFNNDTKIFTYKLKLVLIWCVITRQMGDEFTLWGLLTPVYKMTTSIFNKRLFKTLSKVNKKRKKKGFSFSSKTLKNNVFFFFFC